MKFDLGIGFAGSRWAFAHLAAAYIVMEVQMKKGISGFRDEYYFLSNFSSHPVTYLGKTYQSSEAAFQAQKTLDEVVQWKFTALSPRDARTEGRRLMLRPDWEGAKDGIMRDILKCKFSNPALMGKLLGTGDAFLEEANTWHDNYWGNCTCDRCGKVPGKNMLGKLLMELREELKEELSYDAQRIQRL